MLKMASESFIHTLLLFLGLFLKITGWVPLYDVPSNFAPNGGLKKEATKCSFSV